MNGTLFEIASSYVIGEKFQEVQQIVQSYKAISLILDFYYLILDFRLSEKCSYQHFYDFQGFLLKIGDLLNVLIVRLSLGKRFEL